MQHVADIHAVERVVLPRSLVGRPAFAHEMLEAIDNTPLEYFEVGDIITFECAEGWYHTITILGVRPNGAVDAMAYDGEPHYVLTAVKAIVSLRVVRRDRMSIGDVAMYRRILSLG